MTPAELTPELLRAAMLRHGSLLVRGVMDPADATAMATEIETALQARTALAAGGGASEGYYEEFDPGPPVDLALAREWVGDGGMWAADSPKLMFEMFEAFERSGLRRVIHGYLNEIPAISIEKCTLRRVDAGQRLRLAPGRRLPRPGAGAQRVDVAVALRGPRRPGSTSSPSGSRRSSPPGPRARSSTGRSRRRWSRA